MLTFVGLITVFAGYTAVYALNDLMDLRTDRERIRIDSSNKKEKQMDLDGVLTRHPMAKGVLKFKAGLIWTSAWALIAFMGAFWLNPVCLLFFVTGCLLEVLYCKLWRITPLRTLINGLVKTLGAMAAVFAVQPSPNIEFLLLLFLWLFFWEIGGQNIPNDWADVNEDRLLQARTIPIYFGLHKAGILSIAALTAALFFHLGLLWASPLAFGPFFLLMALALNLILLLIPAFKMVKHRHPSSAMALFNKASYYPLATLALVLVRMAV
jgi:4-hydroxybenzoate polyprenyltransferase